MGSPGLIFPLHLQHLLSDLAINGGDGRAWGRFRTDAAVKCVPKILDTPAYSAAPVYPVYRFRCIQFIYFVRFTRSERCNPRLIHLCAAGNFLPMRVSGFLVYPFLRELLGSQRPHAHLFGGFTVLVLVGLNSDTAHDCRAGESG